MTLLQRGGPLLQNNVVGEIQNRFAEINSSYIICIIAMLPSSKDFLKQSTVTELADLLEISKEDLKIELPVVSKYLKSNVDKNADLQHILDALFTVKSAFPCVYRLYAGAVTMGISTAVCENSFSTLTRILRPTRRSMSPERLSQLIVLAFKKELTSNIDMEEFVKIFGS